MSVNVNGKRFQVRVQFKKRGKHALIFIPASDAIELLDFVIANTFKERTVSL